MKVTEIRAYSDFLNLQDDWERFLKGCHHTIFSTWTWLSTWWKFYGEKRRLLILLAKDDDNIVGIAPLMYSVEKMFGLHMGRISFIGTPHADYNDFIIRDKKEECIKLFIYYLKSIPENWHCIELNDIPENTETLSILSKTTRNLKLIHPSPYTNLPESYEKFLRGPNGKKRFTDVDRHFKALQKIFKVEVLDCSNPESVDEGMRSLFELHQSRWMSKGLSGAFVSSTFQSFHLAIARSFAEKGWLGLFLLKLSGNPVAALYGFTYNSKYYLYLTGFNPKYAKYGVGSMLITSVIRESINKGLTEFDFMRGDEAYKTRWASSTRWNRNIIITQTNSLVRAQYWILRKFWNRGKELKSLLRIQQKKLSHKT